MIGIALVIIVILSIGLAILSLRNLQKGISTKETKEELEKERVVFHSSDLPSSESTS